MGLVLIVDDERDLATLLEFTFQEAGEKTRTVFTGEQALRALDVELPDLIVLDVMLPDISGFELCRRIKKGPTQQVPVILLTAKADETDRVTGFEAGADDYVVKPFSVKELVLRARAVMRRSVRPKTQQVLEFGCLRLDLSAHRCFVDDEEVTLTALEFRLMQHLLQRQGRVQTRDQLLSDVWGIYSPQETRTVDTHVMRLREKLGAARDYLETVRGVGYRFVDTVT